MAHPLLVFPLAQTILMMVWMVCLAVGGLIVVAILGMVLFMLAAAFITARRDTKEHERRSFLRAHGSTTEATIIRSNEVDRRREWCFVGDYQFTDDHGVVHVVPFHDCWDDDTGSRTASGRSLQEIYAVGARVRIRYQPDRPTNTDFNPVLADLEDVQAHATQEPSVTP